MACSLNPAVSSGRGVQFPFNKSSVFRARGGAVTAGLVYMLAEGLTTDDADVTLPANQGDNGSLANTIPIPATGWHTGASGWGTFVLALESAADDGLYRGVIEGYYVDATVVAAGAMVIRAPLFLNASEQLTDTQAATEERQPIHARVLEVVAGAGTATRKVHFNGTPGGFGVRALDT